MVPLMKGVVENTGVSKGFYKIAGRWMERCRNGRCSISIRHTESDFRFYRDRTGSLTLPFEKILLVVCFGKTLKGVLIAYTCFWILE